jgi:hypothetical protein
MPTKVLTRAEEERARLERRLESNARDSARKTETAVFARNKVSEAREKLARIKEDMQEAQALTSCRQTEVTTAHCVLQEAQALTSCRQDDVTAAHVELDKAVLQVTKLEGSNLRQERITQEAELASMEANVAERRAEEEKARTFKLVKVACELAREGRLESVESEASTCSQDLGQVEEMRKTLREDKRKIMQLSKGVQRMQRELERTGTSASSQEDLPTRPVVREDNSSPELLGPQPLYSSSSPELLVQPPQVSSSSPELLPRPTGARPRQQAVVVSRPQGYDSPSAVALRGHQRLYGLDWPAAERAMTDNMWELAERKLRELIENVVYVAKRFGSKYSAGELRELGQKRVELELQAMTCRFKRGKFDGWVVTLQRLESDPYLGKKEKVRLDVFRGKCASTYRPDL